MSIEFGKCTECNSSNMDMLVSEASTDPTGVSVSGNCEDCGAHIVYGCSIVSAEAQCPKCECIELTRADDGKGWLCENCGHTYGD